MANPLVDNVLIFKNIPRGMFGSLPRYMKGKCLQHEGIDLFTVKCTQCVSVEEICAR